MLQNLIRFLLASFYIIPHGAFRIQGQPGVNHGDDSIVFPSAFALLRELINGEIPPEEVCTPALFPSPGTAHSIIFCCSDSIKKTKNNQDFHAVNFNCLIIII